LLGQGEAFKKKNEYGLNYGLPESLSVMKLIKNISGNVISYHLYSA